MALLWSLSLASGAQDGVFFKVQEVLEKRSVAVLRSKQLESTKEFIRHRTASLLCRIGLCRSGKMETSH